MTMYQTGISLGSFPSNQHQYYHFIQDSFKRTSMHWTPKEKHEADAQLSSSSCESLLEPFENLHQQNN